MDASGWTARRVGFRLTCALLLLGGVPLEQVWARVEINVIDKLNDETIAASWPVTQQNSLPRFGSTGPIRGKLCMTISLSGQISAGDAVRFRKAIDAEQQRLNPDNDLVSFDEAGKPERNLRCFDVARLSREHQVPHNLLTLNSGGGNFKEAVQIAEIAREFNFTTVVPKGAKCLSACAIVFLNGTYRQNSWDLNPIPSRWMHVGAQVGLHAPFPAYAGDMKFSTDEARSIYGTGAKQIVQYFDMVRTAIVDNRVLDEILKETSPDKFKYINTIDEAVRWNIDLFGYKKPAISEDDRGIFAACANIWNRHLTKNAMEYEEPEVLRYAKSDLKGLQPMVSNRAFIEEGYAFYLNKTGPSNAPTYTAIVKVGGARFNWEIRCRMEAAPAMRSAGLRTIVVESSTVPEVVTPLPLSKRIPIWFLFFGEATLSEVQ